MEASLKTESKKTGLNLPGKISLINLLYVLFVFLQLYITLCILHREMIKDKIFHANVSVSHSLNPMQRNTQVKYKHFKIALKYSTRGRALSYFSPLKSEVSYCGVPSVMKMEPQNCPDCHTDGGSSCDQTVIKNTVYLSKISNEYFSLVKSQF